MKYNITLLSFLFVIPLSFSQTKLKVKETTGYSQQEINRINSEYGLPTEREFEVETINNTYGQYEPIKTDFSDIAWDAYAKMSLVRESMGVPPREVPLRGQNLDGFKYIVLDQISGAHNGETRRFIAKNLEKAGFQVVNLRDPKKTHDKLPEDLLANPNLGLYAYIETEKGGCFRVHFSIYTFLNQLVHYNNGDSCGMLSGAIKKSIGSLTGYRYSFKEESVMNARDVLAILNEGSMNGEKTVNTDDAINEIKELKELLDSGILTQEEYDAKAAELKKIILGDN